MTHIISNITISLAAFLVFVAGIFYTPLAYAGSEHTLSGFAWGGTSSISGSYSGIGWVSFNSTSDSSSVNYGVNVPIGDGLLSGNAWSENYGWLSFDVANLSGCPSGVCSASRSGNSIQGWARFIASNGGVNSGGWSGWVSLSGINVVGTNLSGYAWSSELGWIDMSTVVYTAPVPSATGSGTGCYILDGSTSCSGLLNWNIQNAISPNVMHEDGTVYSTNPNQINFPVTLQYGINTFYIRNGGVNLYSVPVVASCLAVSSWFSGACYPIPPPKPEITINSERSVIRSGDTTIVTAEVLAGYPVTCDIYGLETAPVTFNHASSSLPSFHTFTTRPLFSAQNVTFNCIPNPSIIGIATTTGQVRINVVPTVQEI